MERREINKLVTQFLNTEMQYEIDSGGDIRSRRGSDRRVVIQRAIDRNSADEWLSDNNVPEEDIQTFTEELKARNRRSIRGGG